MSPDQVRPHLSQRKAQGCFVTNRVPPDEIHAVINDDFAIGQAAARHLVLRGCRSLVFAGTPSLHFAFERLAGFRELAGGFGLPVHVLWRSTETFAFEHARVRLEMLPRPIGLFGATDGDALSVREVLLREPGLRLPGDVYLLGCDNTGAFPGEGSEDLSSVEPDVFCLGWKGVERAVRIVMEPDLETSVERIPPLGVVERRSSRAGEFTDVLVQRSLEIIQESLADGINVASLVDELPVSRRRFEQRFLAAIGMSPAAYLRRERFKRARHAILEGDAPLADIAREVGLADQRRLTLLFEEMIGTPPSALRRRAEPVREDVIAGT